MRKNPINKPGFGEAFGVAGQPAIRLLQSSSDCANNPDPSDSSKTADQFDRAWCRKHFHIGAGERERAVSISLKQEDVTRAEIAHNALPPCRSANTRHRPDHDLDP
jgi:hypothetical protein